MTSTTDTAGHPEVTELSDLVEGLLPPSQGADLRRHLDECPLCADVYDSLEEIRGLLGTLPGPPQMPADVAGRIDAALAAEALLNATAPDVDSARARVPVGASRTELDAVDSTHVSRETTAAADRPAGHGRAATGPGRSSSKRRMRRRTAVLGTVLTVAMLGLGTVLIQSMGGDSPDDPVVAQSKSASESTFSGDTLQNQVTELIAENRGKSSFGTEAEPKPGTPGSPTDGPSTLLTINVPDCISDGIGRNEPPLGARQGEYEGAKAYLVVLPDPSDTDRVTAYVVDAACAGKPQSAPGKVLEQQSYALPAAPPSPGP